MSASNPRIAAETESRVGCPAPFVEQRPARVAIILNPRSGGGRAERQWRRIEPRVASMLPEYRVFRTDKPGSGTDLTRQALREGYDRIVSAGGDGTHFEVVNGFFDGAAPINPNASFALLPVGTASDLRKTYALPTLQDAVARLASPCVLPIDLGRLRSHGEDGIERLYHFNTAVHMGLGSLVNEHVNRRSKALGGLLTFALGVLTARLAYQPIEMCVTADGQEFSGRFLEVIVAKGFYDGGGMSVAPHGTLDSGLFEVYLIGPLGTLGSLIAAARLYSGTHGEHPAVRYLRAKHVTVTAREPVYAGPDGEVAGQLPATLEVVPRAIRAVTGPKPRVS
jgi:YegS/Rv2252/BmrU family lipid kinase